MSGRTVTAAVFVMIVLTAGCIGFLTGEEPQSFEASPASVGQETADDAGYEKHGPTPLVENRKFSAGGESRTVQVTSHLTEYRKTASIGPIGDRELAAVAVLSTPEVNVLGETFNPVGDMSNDDLVREFTEKYEGISVDEQVGSTTVTALGTDTEVTKYAGQSTFVGGTTIDVYLHVTKVNHAGDFVVVIAVYPQALSGEEESVLAMIRDLDH